MAYEAWDSSESLEDSGPLLELAISWAEASQSFLSNVAAMFLSSSSFGSGYNEVLSKNPFRRRQQQHEPGCYNNRLRNCFPETPENHETLHDVPITSDARLAYGNLRPLHSWKMKSVLQRFLCSINSPSSFAVMFRTMRSPLR